jgi:hypothetical protein
MNKKTITIAFLTGILASALVPRLQAQTKFTGDFLFGYRFVDTSGPGADYKYREDINLRGGARLYSFSLSYTPDNEYKKYFDRFDLRLANLGGDPYEAVSVSLQKYGRYAMTYDRRKSNYFYHDLAQTERIGGLYDLHTFDFDRVTDSGSAKVWLSDRADVFFTFDRYTRKGASTTTLDVERIEVEFDRPVQEESKQVGVGLDVHFKRLSFVLEEKYINYKNDNSYLLPGLTDGGPQADYPTSLNFYFMNQPYELKTWIESLQFIARPFDRLLLTGSAQLSRLDENLTYSEFSQGINYLNRKFQFDVTGTGKFERNLELYELDANYLVLNKLSLVAAVRYHNLDQTGSLTTSGGTDAVDFGYNTLGVDAGVQYEFAPRLILTLGYRFEDRDLDNLETVTYDFKTTKNGAFGNLHWDPFRTLKLTFDYEHSAYDNPFTLISPTSYDRFRMTAKYQMKVFSLTATYLYNNAKSDIDEDMFKTTRNQFSLRAGLHGAKFKGFVGYAYLESKRSGLRTVSYPPFWTGPGGTFLWDILYEGRANLFDANLSYDVNEFWKLGAYANYYSNKGSYEVERAMVRAYIEYSFWGGYSAQFGYRHVNFKETVLGFNNYQANIVELSFGYRWK